jgi:glycine dehydrogenase subunit 2
MSKTAFEISQSGQHAYSLPKDSQEFMQFTPTQELLRESDIGLPEISEIDLTRHFSKLASRNVGIDNQFYPLGSCTMKLNPRVNEWCAGLPGFTRTHPLAPEDTVQGNLQVVFELTQFLCRVSGMTAGSMLPCAGAQGEYTGIKMIAEYHKQRGETQRTEILIPDNAHGTNPATASMAGFTTVSIRTDATGDLDIGHLKEMISEKTAGLMLTNPSTLGLFSPNIMEITSIVHENGALLYYDGANLNAILNIVRPGDMGFDVMHINLHKTFSTPHGGGGPGAGPVLCNDKLKDFLPVPRVEKINDQYQIVSNDKASIGRICSFHGNFGIYLRAYLYAMLHGHFGLRRISENAVLNANYLKTKLGKYFTVPFPQYCMHEFVLQADNYLDKDIRALDIAKRLLDYHVHAPTIYFPLIIKECMLVEPTESESKETLDRFVEIMGTIVEEIKQDPDMVKKAPYDTPVSRLDEVQAAKKPILKHIINTSTMADYGNRN